MMDQWTKKLGIFRTFVDLDETGNNWFEVANEASADRAIAAYTAFAAERDRLTAERDRLAAENAELRAEKNYAEVDANKYRAAMIRANATLDKLNRRLYNGVNCQESAWVAIDDCRRILRSKPTETTDEPD